MIVLVFLLCHPHNRQNIINGPKVHPGANAVEIQPGVKRQLDRMSKSERVAVADALLTRKSASEG